MTRSLRGKDGRLDALPNSDGFRDLVIRPESAKSTKNVAPRIEGRGEKHAEGREHAAARESMNRTAGLRKVALGALAASSLFAGGSAAFPQQQTTGTPVYTYNLLDLKRTRLAGTEALTPGKHLIEYDFKYNGLSERTLAYNNTSGVGKGGTGTLKVDGKVVSTETLEATLPLVKQLDDTFNIGSAGASPVDDKDYKVPFKFTGTINKVTIAVDPPVLTPADIQKLQSATHSASD
jgi:hypothetical protein